MQVLLTSKGQNGLGVYFIRSTDRALIFENWAAGASDGVAATGIAQ